MNTALASPDDLYREAAAIQDYLEITLSEEMAEAVARGNDLTVYIARTGKMLADAKCHLRAKQRSEAMEVVQTVLKSEKISAGVQNSLIESACREEHYLVEWLERLNRSATHQLEWCRSVVSKGKEEMRLNQAGREFK